MTTDHRTNANSTGGASKAAMAAGRPRKPKAARYKRMVTATVSVLVLLIVLTAMVGLSMPWYWQVTPDAVQENNDESQNPASKSASEGTITLQTAQGGCATVKFNNDNGQFGQAVPCPKTPVDANGVPVPVATINRLNAINKSFFSNTR